MKLVRFIHGDEVGFDNNGCKTRRVWEKSIDFINYIHDRNIILKAILKYKFWCGDKAHFWIYIRTRDQPLKQ